MENKVKTGTFSKDYTNFAKGIAVLLLLAHHLFYKSCHVPLKTITLSPQLLTCLTKVCVCVFTVLSGYGLTISYKRKNPCGAKANADFVFLHIKKLLTNFWWIYVPVFVLSFWINVRGTPVDIYGSGITGVISGCLDFFGLRGVFYRPTLCSAWWYMGAVLIYYLLFPFIFKASNKAPALAIAVAAMPCALRVVFKKFFSTTNREMFYLLPFVVGVVFADRYLLNKAVIYADRHKTESLLFSLVFLFVTIALATQIMLLGNTVYACAIIFFCIAVKALNLKYLNRLLEIFGKYSMDIYLFHVFIYSDKSFFVIGGRIQGIDNPILRYVTLAAVCLVIAVIIERIKKLYYNVTGAIAARLKKTDKVTV